MSNTPASRPTASRRYFLGGTAALALLPLTATAQHITANASLQSTPGQDTATLAAKEDSASHLTVEVRINGQGPYHFVVDTGAERSVIADNVAAVLNLPQGKSVLVDGISSRILAQTVNVDALSFGPFVKNNLSLPVLARTSLFADGYLGLDVINGSRVTFDFTNKAVHIEQPHTLSPTQDNAETARVSARGSSGKLRVTDCMVDSIPANAFIDTGAEVSVGNTPLFERLSGRNHGVLQTGTIVLTGVTGGEIQGQVINVSRIKLQDLSFTNGSLAIADVPDFDNWDLRNHPALLIGMDYLRQFASVTIDYRAKEIRFELSLAPPLPTPGVEIASV